MIGALKKKKPNKSCFFLPSSSFLCPPLLGLCFFFILLNSKTLYLLFLSSVTFPQKTQNGRKNSIPHLRKGTRWEREKVHSTKRLNKYSTHININQTNTWWVWQSSNVSTTTMSWNGGCWCYYYWGFGA